MGTIKRDPEGNDGFCRYCGETGLSPGSTVCNDPNCEPSEDTYKECANHACRNLLGPLSVESSDKYCSMECASQSV